MGKCVNHYYTERPAMTHTEQEIAAAWNAQADELNQWDELDMQEKIEWAAKFGKNQAARHSQPVPRTPQKKLPQVFIDKLAAQHGLDFLTYTPFARAVEKAAHHVTQEKQG